MTTSATLRHIWHRHLSEASVRAVVRVAVAVAPLVRRLAGEHPAPAPDATPSPAPFSVTVVDDPEGATRLVGVRGLLEPRTVGVLEALLADTEPSTLVHIDLSSADLWPADVLGRLELALDRAERRGVRLRVVGIDPAHLAMTHRPCV